jgi:mRNA interferase HigB
MRIVKPSRVREYAKNHADVAASLLAWLRVAGRAKWQSIRDVRQTYPHADAVKAASGRIVTVFNFGGNKYRLIASIKHQWSMVYVLRFLTHAEYDKDKWKDQL